MIGQTFNQLTVISPLESRNGKRWWLCLCSCGETTEVRTSRLQTTLSCGCIRRRKHLICQAPNCDRPTEVGDYCGGHYARARQGKSLDAPIKIGSVKVSATCPTCQRVFEYFPSDDRTYCSVACVKPGGPITHGESRTRLYNIWHGMKSRCQCEGCPAYAYYGGRGITVCQEWRDDYKAFRDWSLANGYADDLEIDRRDTNGNYEPSNCRWATRVQQMRNSRKRKNARTSVFKGVSRDTRDNELWNAQGSQDGRTFLIGAFATEIEAALAYDDFAFRRDSEFCVLNFPERYRRTEVSIDK